MLRNARDLAGAAEQAAGRARHRFRDDPGDLRQPPAGGAAPARWRRRRPLRRRRADPRPWPAGAATHLRRGRQGPRITHRLSK